MKQQFVISIGFPQYIKDKSGMSKVIMAHQSMFNEKEISYVHLFAIKKMVLKDKITLFSYFGMYIDGEFAGVFTANDVVRWCNNCFKEGKVLCGIHVHHFLYMKIDNISAILDNIPEAKITIFLHDYYLACSNYNLMRNNMMFCGGKGLCKENCEDCCSYTESVKIQQQIHSMINKFSERITFVAPSNNTQNIFLKFHPEYINQIVVIPHQKQRGNYLGNLDRIDCEKMKIGFMAMPRIHKGWKIWEKIVNQFPDQYEYIVFNSSDDQYDGMEKVKIEFNQNNLNAMVDAVRLKQVDAVFLWSLCSETYSYTCYEAFSSNAFIITNSISGNIADTVIREKNGVVIDSEEELFELIASPNKLKELINQYREGNEGGPLELVDNDYIVELTMNKAKTNVTNSVNNNTLLDFLLKKCLFVLYKNGLA